MPSWLVQHATTDPREIRSISPCKQRVRGREIILIVCLILSAATKLPAAQEISQKTLELAYTARVERPTTHTISIEIVARQVQSISLDFVIPAWAPGRYAIYDFAKGVQEFSAKAPTMAPCRGSSWTSRRGV